MKINFRSEETPSDRLAIALVAACLAIALLAKLGIAAQLLHLAH